MGARIVVTVTRNLFKVSILIVFFFGWILGGRRWSGVARRRPDSFVRTGCMASQSKFFLAKDLTSLGIILHKDVTRLGEAWTSVFPVGCLGGVTNHTCLFVVDDFGDYFPLNPPGRWVNGMAWRERKRWGAIGVIRVSRWGWRRGWIWRSRLSTATTTIVGGRTRSVGTPILGHVPRRHVRGGHVPL